MEIPPLLQRAGFRFYLAHDKLPIEKQWNSVNNYMFMHEKLLNHINSGENYGIVTGYGNLIVLDFDDQKYYESVLGRLPKTFTVLTAKKRLPHMYYLLDGDMFKKTSVRNKEDKTLMDIQADRCGIIAPGSKIGDRQYVVAENYQLADITAEALERVFPVKLVVPREYHDTFKDSPEASSMSGKILDLIGVCRGKQSKLWECPFHRMEGKGNLSVLPSGRIYCFHEQKVWSGGFSFAREYYQRLKNPTKRDIDTHYAIDVIKEEKQQ